LRRNQAMGEMRSWGGPRTKSADWRSLPRRSGDNSEGKMDDGRLAPEMTAGATSAHCETVSEQRQLCRQHAGAWRDGPEDSCVCGAFPLQHLRIQQVSGEAYAARATGAKMPTSDSRSNSLAVRRCMKWIIGDGCGGRKWNRVGRVTFRSTRFLAGLQRICRPPMGNTER
jgi:hypothetical protein